MNAHAKASEAADYLTRPAAGDLVCTRTAVLLNTSGHVYVGLVMIPAAPLAIEHHSGGRAPVPHQAGRCGQHTTRFMLSSSDCESRTIAEVLELEPDAHARLLECWCGYTEPPGGPELRQAIASLYERTGSGEVVVTSCAEEGIFLLYHAFLQPGDHAIVETPCYESALQLARSTGAEVSQWRRRYEDGWAHDLDALAALIRPATRLIYVNQPHDPTASPVGFPRVREISDVARYCVRLAETGVLLLPGSVYDQPGHVRIGFGRANMPDALSLLEANLDGSQQRLSGRATRESNSADQRRGQDSWHAQDSKDLGRGAMWGSSSWPVPAFARG